MENLLGLFLDKAKHFATCHLVQSKISKNNESVRNIVMILPRGL